MVTTVWLSFPLICYAVSFPLILFDDKCEHDFMWIQLKVGTHVTFFVVLRFYFRLILRYSCAGVSWQKNSRYQGSSRADSWRTITDSFFCASSLKCEISCQQTYWMACSVYCQTQRIVVFWNWGAYWKERTQKSKVIRTSSIYVRVPPYNKQRYTHNVVLLGDFNLFNLMCYSLKRRRIPTHTSSDTHKGRPNNSS